MELGRIALPGGQPSPPVVSGDGRFVAVVHNNVAKVWNLQTGEFVFKSVPDRNRLYGVALSQDGSIVLTRTPTGVDRWDLAGGNRKVLAAVPNPRGFALSPDGRRVVIFSAGGGGRGPVSTAIYDVESGRKTDSLQVDSPGRAPSFHPTAR